MKRKILISLCVFMILVVGLPKQAFAGAMIHGQDYAHEYVPIMPLWLNTVHFTLHFDIQNGRASMSGMILGVQGTESITVNAHLDRINPNGTPTRIGTWNNLRVNSRTWAWERVHFVARGHYYRLTLTAVVSRNGINEVITMSRTVFAR